MGFDFGIGLEVEPAALAEAADETKVLSDSEIKLLLGAAAVFLIRILQG